MHPDFLSALFASGEAHPTNEVGWEAGSEAGLNAPATSLSPPRRFKNSVKTLAKWLGWFRGALWLLLGP